MGSKPSVVGGTPLHVNAALVHAFVSVREDARAIQEQLKEAVPTDAPKDAPGA